MTLRTKKDRNAETTDNWETLLTRRLADELDAFLEEANEETFLLLDEANAPRRTTRNGKRLRYKALATAAASAALLCGVASLVCLYVDAPKTENVVESRQVDGEPSLLAWSVESLTETPWARQVETTLSSADVFGLYAASTPTEETEAERLADAEDDNATQVEEDEWFNLEVLSNAATAKPLKYEPFLQAVVATLQ